MGLAATIGVTAVITRIARQALAQVEGAQPDGRGHEMLKDDEFDQKLMANVRPPDWTNPTPAGRYNMVVLGAGTAGLVAAAGAAGMGAKVALIERDQLGGDCLNVGCVPSKALLRSAHAVADIRRAGGVGVHVESEARVDFGEVMSRLRRVRARISRTIRQSAFRTSSV